MKKVLTLLVAVALVMACMVPFASAEEYQSKTGYELSEKVAQAYAEGLLNLDVTAENRQIVLDPEAFEAKYGKISVLFVNDASRTVAPEDLAMVKRWAAETGLNFEWQSIPADGATEKINLMLASGDELPDVFWNFGDGKSSSTVISVLDQDVFMPTEDLMAEFCPTLMQIFADHPQYEMEATAPDGHKYGFPYIEEMYGLVMTPGPLLINQTWLDAVGMDMPTTPDELVEVLRAFKAAGDLNGNGVDDEIPLATWFGSEDTFGSYDMFYRFTGYYGCEDTYSGGNKYADHLRQIDGKVVYTALDPAMRETANLFHTMYSEGLLNADCILPATASTNYTNNECTQDVAIIGVLGLWSDMTITNNEVRHQYVAIPMMTNAENGGFTGNALNYSEMQDACDTAITVDCDMPELVACFIEYLVSDGSLSVQSNWGAAASEEYTDGLSCNYYYDENGILRFALDENGDIIPRDANDPNWDSFGDMRTNTTTCRGSMIVLKEYYNEEVVDDGNGGKMWADKEDGSGYAEYAYDAANLLLFQYVNGKAEAMETYDILPKIMLPADEQAELSRMYDKLAGLVDTYVATAVQEGDSDELWNQYLADMEANGVARYVEIWQTAMDRVNG